MANRAAANQPNDVSLKSDGLNVPSRPQPFQGLAAVIVFHAAMRFSCCISCRVEPPSLRVTHCNLMSGVASQRNMQREPSRSPMVK